MGFVWVFSGMAVTLRLGDLTFDPDARQLRREGEEIHLSPKAFELLKILIDQRPRALSKNELHQHLWPATFVSEANLASLIAEIREALGDTARQPRFIRTAHRFGYGFCGETVDESEPQGRKGTVATSFCWLIRNGKRLPLRSGENILGRESDDGNITLDSQTVSRRHARISILANGASLEDLGSKNGTFLRGEPVTTVVALLDRDEIRVGSVVLRFRTATGSRTATWTNPD
jgi:DNA-binding winged helix-turn-helix (wHTH) protein